MSPAEKFDQKANALAQAMQGNALVRAVNFHSAPRAKAEQYRRQLAALAARFSPVTESDLDRYLATGHWPKPKPGVIIAVYEGYRNGFDVLLPLLEDVGLIGWFFIITGFINAPPDQQADFAAAHDIEMPTREYPDRHALSWDEIRAIDRRHVVASHARSHVWLDTLPSQEQEAEIVGSQKEFSRQLGHPVRAFVSYGGPPHGRYPAVDRLVIGAGYQFVFSNFKIQRLRA